ncbi:hypothetical protein B0H67DRAFT_480312 [Lasiosphaeris hirsuta]|uniref:ATP-grasp domain-containing protein n=1 Tax=Lasiosphaeris hirsuta TaxID=260670 RepID=A0AA40AZX3_9PEZI|nr:hypothetical protein B0H67DRAFT_480312 [Lasiosphaeris hirsuta]
MKPEGANTSGGIQNAEFISKVFFVDVNDRKDPVKVSCRWRFSEPPAVRDAPRTVINFHSLDLLLDIDCTPWVEREHEPGDGSEADVIAPHATSSALGTLVGACIARGTAGAKAIAMVAKVVLVPRGGFLCRQDILELRMRHSEHAASVVGFATPDGGFPAIPAEGGRATLPVLLSSSPGALLGKESSQAPPGERLELLASELEHRLSFDWVLPTQPLPRTVAMLGGRRLYDMAREQYGAKGLLEAAQALGISVIVLDASGHWLEGETYAHLRDDFVAIDMAAGDARLPSHIAEALKGRQLDGIVTFSDELVIATARAAEMLGLPTEPAALIVRAHYKDATRRVVRNPRVQVVRLDDAEHLDDPPTAERLAELEYPLIVKPCRAAASRGVRKVGDLSALRQAVRKMDDEGLTKHGILIETYVDGPEVDANLVLWDGELLFCEISDDFPCSADAADATIADDFSETLMVHPTALDPGEVELLQSVLHENLLQLGFRSGVFHVEARVQNSSMRYGEINGIQDLVHGEAEGGPKKGPPGVFLVEVNARPPGFDATWATLHTYGVDMGALQFLCALGDRERYKALSQPFSEPAHQFWCGNRQVPMHRENMYVPPDFFERVFAELPEIVSYLVRAEFFAEPGSTVSPRAGSGFVAFFILFSRKSRMHVVEMCDRVLRVSINVLDNSA